jgi:hypothetical protein
MDKLMDAANASAVNDENKETCENGKYTDVGVIDDIDNSDINFFSAAFQGKPIGTVLKNRYK